MVSFSLLILCDVLLQGILFSSAECVKTPMDLVRLWMHECDRVYRDKLVDEKDMENYDRIQADVTKKIFEVSLKTAAWLNCFSIVKLS